MDIIEALAVMEAVYKFDARKAPDLLMYIANKIFKQNWTVGEEKMQKAKDKSEELNDKSQKQRRNLSSLDFQLPDRATIAKIVEDFALLSYTDMTESMFRAKRKGKTVTYGADDTIKAAGHRRHDVKTIHVTIIDEYKKG